MAMTFTLDMTMMFAVHDALRRDLKRIVTMTARSVGWDQFKRYLLDHHLAEDDTLWPALREALADQSEHVALVDEMEAEHAALAPLLDEIDGALDRGETAPASRTELIALLEEHLTHEEDHALPLIDRMLDLEEWMHFGEAAAARIGPDMPNFLPWLLDGADPDRTSTILGHLPQHARETYRSAWEPAYAAQDWWAA